MSDLKQFSFFRSYYMSLKNLTPEEIGQIVILMSRYMFEDEELPVCEGVQGAVIELIRPILYKSKTKALAGQIGGESKPEANPKQNESNPEAIKEKEKGNKDKDNGNKEKKSTRFTPPTLEEVSAYCRERHNGINAKQFVDYFEKKDWKIGYHKMDDWKIEIAVWEKEKKAGGKLILL